MNERGMSFTFLSYEVIDKLLVFITDSNLETLLNHQPDTITAYKSYLVNVSLNGQARLRC